MSSDSLDVFLKKPFSSKSLILRHMNEFVCHQSGAICAVQANNDAVQKGSREVWPRFEALAKRASAIRTHSSVLTENPRRVQRTSPWSYSSDCTRFFEAEIAWSTVKRLTDNDMIEQVDLSSRY